MGRTPPVEQCLIAVLVEYFVAMGGSVAIGNQQLLYLIPLDSWTE
jgi:hypothetical protein